ncbi:hypothetical protein [Synechocystis sp. CS-94]|uniref:hypothetical protein n=1 Tax=Synechocystis sp. CS-94 TaxID=2847986 RepID=UPI00040BED0A|nr:hypothetical protein [Synechocystis sp. CS-94]AIE75091.1 hypothetical protein D082_25620 [Synechocystis sp. PCC 6714]MCT0253211.1 hypothetical protein [Synechocystis sp. CS-94]
MPRPNNDDIGGDHKNWPRLRVEHFTLTLAIAWNGFFPWQSMGGTVPHGPPAIEVDEYFQANIIFG